jgi:uncharacterized protein (TIGR01777 family)
MAKILISGGRGLIGNHLSKKLREKAYEVIILSRNKEKNTGISTNAEYSVKLAIEKETIVNTDYIIHLAGANISEKRWTKKRKQLIIDSRVQTAQQILDKIKENNQTLKAFISASAVGYYGSITSEKIFTESDISATDFLGNCCNQWEKAADKFEEMGIRTVKIRTGIVLSKTGGALEKMKLPVKMGIGSALGNGKQYMPWIHIDDLCDIYIKAIEDEQMKGAYNAVAPDTKTNNEFTGILAKVLKKLYWFPNLPAFVLKIIFGNMSDILLKGSRVSAVKIQTAGYHFKYPELEPALKDLCEKAEN